MWKEPSPDFKLSSATLGLKAPFYVNLGVSLNTVCTPVQSSKIPSQEGEGGIRSLGPSLQASGFLHLSFPLTQGPPPPTPAPSLAQLGKPGKHP